MIQYFHTHRYQKHICFYQDLTVLLLMLPEIYYLGEKDIDQHL